MRRALGALGDVVPLLADDHLAGAIFESRPDIVVHVPGGEASPSRRLHVAAFLEYYDIPFLGSDALTQATCLQRARMKESLAYHGVSTPDFAVLGRREQLAAVARLGFPSAVRPARGRYGASPALVAHDADELRDIADALFAATPDEGLLVERVLPGDAFACTILGNGDESVILPLVMLDRLPDDQTTAAGSAPVRRVTAHVSEGLGEAIESVALRAWHALGLRDMARIDVQLNEAGVPSVRGIDPLPSLSGDDPDGSVFAASRAAGLDDHELVQRCLVIAARRAGVELPQAPRFARLPRRTPPGGIRAPLLA
jgi:D-alanine-D-alanine ligase